MKKHKIKVGENYIAKISGKLTTVRVDAIRETNSYRAHQPHTPTTRYDVTNLVTGRRTTFRSALKFRRAGRYLTETEFNTTYAAKPLTDSIHPDGF